MANDAERLLDEIGWTILCALQENARMTDTDLARLAGVTSPTVANRIRRLEEEGVITGYHAAVNAVKLSQLLQSQLREIER